MKDYYSFLKVDGRSWDCISPILRDIETWKHQRKQLKVVSFLGGLDAPYVSSRNQFLYGAGITFSRLSRIPLETNDSIVSDLSALNTFAHSPCTSLVERVKVVEEMVVAWADEKTNSVNFVIPLVMLRRSIGVNMTNLIGLKLPPLLPIRHLLPSPTTTELPTTSNIVSLSHDDFESLLKLAHGDPTPSTSKACLSTHTSPSTWLIDSGASDHMTSNASCFSTFSIFTPRKIILAS